METLEFQIIGTLLRHPEYVSRANVAASDFSNPLCGAAFSAMRAMLSEGQQIEVFTVAERMGGGTVLGDVAAIWRECLSRPENLEEKCDKVRSAARSREMVELLRLAATTLEQGKDPDAVRSRLITRLASIEDGGKKYAHSSRETMSMVTDYLQEVFDAKADGGLVGVPSGIDALDHLMGGFHKSDLIVVGARPAMGKTAFMVSLARNAVMAGKRVGIISAEMSVTQIGLRMASMFGGIPSTKLRSCDLDDQEFTRLNAAAATYAELPISIYDKPSCTPGDIAIQARAWAMSGGLDILFVDYLTRLTPDEPNMSRNREVGQMGASLKTLARTMDIPVVCLSQLSRKCEERADKRPIMADLRDSGEVEQDADEIMFLYRHTVYDEGADPQEAEILLEKNRHGPIKNIKCRFIEDQMLWTNPVSQWDNAYQGESA